MEEELKEQNFSYFIHYIIYTEDKSYYYSKVVHEEEGIYSPDDFLQFYKQLANYHEVSPDKLIIKTFNRLV